MKNVKFNFYSGLAVVITLLLFSFLLLGATKIIDEVVGLTGNEISEMKNQDDEIDDVEGYGMILYGIGALGGVFANLFLGVVIIFIWFLDFFLFILILIARLIYSNKGWRLLTYRILMGFAYALMIGFALVNLSGITSSLFLIAFEIALITIIVLGIRNTYFKKIIEDAQEDKNNYVE